MTAKQKIDYRQLLTEDSRYYGRLPSTDTLAILASNMGGDIEAALDLWSNADIAISDNRHRGRELSSQNRLSVDEAMKELGIMAEKTFRKLWERYCKDRGEETGPRMSDYKHRGITREEIARLRILKTEMKAEAARRSRKSPSKDKRSKSVK